LIQPLASILMLQHFMPGQEVLFTSASPSSSFGAIFEDDGETAYLYATDLARPEGPILDAVHIYNVSPANRAPSFVQIVWSSDGLKAGLHLNSQLQAVFDFSARCAYCRTNFPPPSGGWRRPMWHDRLPELLV
jgi:hypothetical protein